MSGVHIFFSYPGSFRQLRKPEFGDVTDAIFKAQQDFLHVLKDPKNLTYFKSLSVRSYFSKAHSDPIIDRLPINLVTALLVPFHLRSEKNMSSSRWSLLPRPRQPKPSLSSPQYSRLSTR